MTNLESQETERSQGESQVSDLVSDGLWCHSPKSSIQTANSKYRLPLAWHKLAYRENKKFSLLAHHFHSRCKSELSLLVSLVTEEVLCKERKMLITSENANIRSMTSFTSGEGSRRII